MSMTTIKKRRTGTLTVTVVCAALFLLLRYSAVPMFKYIRHQIVATSMTTASHQHIAHIAAAPPEIETIMANMFMGSDRRPEAEEIETMKIPVDTEGFSLLEEGIYLRDIYGMGYSGKLMLVLDPSRIIIGTAAVPGEEPATVQSMVQSYGATAGINGGWYAGYSPTGFVIAGNVCVFSSSESGEQVNIVGFTDGNVLVTGVYNEEEARDAGIRDSLSSYPILIMNGSPLIAEGDGGWGIAPRTAIAQRKDGAVLLLTLDGRQSHSIGATLRQVQDVLMENHAHNAVGLDGGCSTAMYYRGGYLNKPSLGLERSIPTAFLVR